MPPPSGGNSWRASQVSVPKSNEGCDGSRNDDRRQAHVGLANGAHAAPFGRSARLSSSLIARSSASISAWRSRASLASWNAACRLAGRRLTALFDVGSAILGKGRADPLEIIKGGVA